MVLADKVLGIHLWSTLKATRLTTALDMTRGKGRQGGGVMKNCLHTILPACYRESMDEKLNVMGFLGNSWGAPVPENLMGCP